MSRKKNKKASYLTENESFVKIVSTVTCDNCGDVVEIGNMKGHFNCPTCGNDINLKT